MVSAGPTESRARAARAGPAQPMPETGNRTIIMSNDWYIAYFDEDYYHFDHHEDTDLEVDGLARLLDRREGKGILDIGCGYGRVSTPLRKRGYRVVGYDLSPSLLKRAREGDPGGIWVRGDMRELPFAGAFDTAISLFNAFGYFEEEEENFRVLKSVSEALRPGGLFVCQLVNRDYLVRRFAAQEVHRRGGLIILEEREFDAIVNRVLTRTTVFSGADRRADRREYASSIRVYTVTELDLLLAAAGMTIREVHGGLDFRPYDWDTNQLVIVAERTDR